MPELHKLTTVLGIMQDRGHQVALVTDGRMSGASGKVPAAIHVTPEALEGGVIGKIRDGDIVRLDADAGTLMVLASDAELAARPLPTPDLSGNEFGMGRDLFAGLPPDGRPRRPWRERLRDGLSRQPRVRRPSRHRDLRTLAGLDGAAASVFSRASPRSTTTT